MTDYTDDLNGLNAARADLEKIHIRISECQAIFDMFQGLDDDGDGDFAQTMRALRVRMELLDRQDRYILEKVKGLVHHEAD